MNLPATLHFGLHAALLSRQLVSGEITDHTRVTVEFKKGELVFETKAAKKQDRASRLSP